MLCFIEAAFFGQPIAERTKYSAHKNGKVAWKDRRYGQPPERNLRKRSGANQKQQQQLSIKN